MIVVHHTTIGEYTRAISGYTGAVVVMMRLCAGNGTSAERQPELTVREASKRFGQAEHENHEQCRTPGMAIEPCPPAPGGMNPFPIC